ncbi:hypothetical protein [Silvanigrella sp.]|jgi:hypothetical protein|uniref:hypothetical protein n=1 Tax=Silvanigrella sp. TaxID=2024976 RepID=UPI0037C99DD5
MNFLSKIFILSSFFFPTHAHATINFDKSDYQLINKTIYSSFHHDKNNTTKFYCSANECHYGIVINHEFMGITTILKQVNKKNQAKKFIYTKDDFRETRVEYLFQVVLSNGEVKNFTELKAAEVAYLNNRF